MGKKRHQKDKLYLIPSEYAQSWGGCQVGKRKLPFRALPFYCCGLTFLPFKDPVCTLDSDGIVFDKAAILSWLKKYKQNPVNGKELKVKELIDLHFHKNQEDDYVCPVTFKVFNEHTFIVANAKSGHVYSKDAIDEICRKGNLWVDLITSEPFSSKDLITIQDPHKLSVRQVAQFQFVQNDIDTEEMTKAVQGIDDKQLTTVTLQPSSLMLETLKEAEKSVEDRKRKHARLLGGYDSDSSDGEVTKMRKQFSTIYTTPGQAASLTSTAVTKKVGTEFRELTDAEARFRLYEIVKKEKWKSYVKLQTNFGVLSLELRSDLVPEACHNFLLHCLKGTYDGTIFHRIIPRFMIQGGDPLGTGMGGKCAFRGMATFRDDFNKALRHDRRGIIAMANSGIDTNKSQFYITFAPSPHLDDLHTVIGHVTSGLEVLDRLENVRTDGKDRPKGDKIPTIQSVVIFKDPFTEADQILERIDKNGSTKNIQVDSTDFIRSLTEA